MHRQHHHHHQQQAYKRRQLWKQPRFWFLLIIVIFIINLLIAFVTIERHISFATTSSSSFFENGGPPISSYSSASTLTSHRFITESRLWHRMLLMIDQEEEEKNDNNYGLRKKKSKTNNNNNNNQFICGEYHVNSRNNITTIDDNRNDNDDDDNDEDEDENTNTTRRNLVPFGFPNSVRSYVQKEQNRSSSIGSYCTAPPSNPSFVVYSSRRTARSGSNSTNTSSRDDYWRQLVVRVMTFLAFPSVERVNLILREERVDVGVNDNKILHDVDKNNSTTTTTTLFLQNAAKRNKYAKRIQYWNEKDVVNVIPTTSLWDGLNRLDVPSESILWIDGDHYYNNNNNLSNNNNNINNNHNTDIPINGTKLKGRLRVWREIPNALIIPGDDTNTGDNNNNNNRIVSNLQQQQAAAAETKTTTKTNNRLSTIKNLSNGENENDHHNMDSHNNRRITRKTTIKHHIKKISKYFGVCPCFGEGGSGGSDLGTSMTMMSSSKRRMSAPSKLQCTNGSGT
ncbi:hypothetical protein FRACYDRAFT_236182 [Fragilariopsis cylindrus CCMP1102]|uniref:Uncharacterized protein n=1 Tax=Fragilariopsis cylindrus CCMP1102 TaxID=635003 RepID=A0A1E7FPS2_9STRA|nr:hypothetical protein FRACYDRAFT_236182 [Fragilariopsis cylindrus CCMP1102]|eukprot:OEU20114.1 hypothetical protein FRACYDRAFT_236182 [Fragilariopsis cylindrus CCMP1102]